MIVIASSSLETLARWQSNLDGFDAVLAVRHLQSLTETLPKVAPQVLLLDLDLPALDGANGIVALRKANPVTRIVAVTGDVPDESELTLFKAGVRGCCRIDIEPQLLKRVVVAVQQGELWIRRSITPRLLDELGVMRHNFQTSRADVGRLAELTQREREIAAHVGNGESNKQIARQLSITERTVKAHLSEIFRKLGIADRLKLALQVRGLPELDVKASGNGD